MVPEHRGWDRLVTVRTGAVLLRNGCHVAVLDRERAAWIGAEGLADVDVRARVDLRVAFVRGVRRRRAVVRMTGLAHELIERIVERGWLDPAVPGDARLLGVTHDEFAALVPLERPVALAMPSGGHARSAALACDDGRLRALRDLAHIAGCSPRTLERAFVRETGLGVAAWARRLRLLSAAASLAAGASVTDAALECGYAGTSAFITAFREAFGTTPNRFRPRL